MWKPMLIVALALSSVNAISLDALNSPSSAAAASLTHKKILMSLAAMPQFHFQPFQFTNISLDCVQPAVGVNYTCGVKFDWHDPNSVKQNNVSSTSCNGNWTWDGINVVGGDDNSLTVQYDPCWKDETEGTYFAMRLMTFVDPGNFTLQVAHNYRDSENFTAPWDYPTTFAEPTFSLTVMNQSTGRILAFSAGPVNGTVVGLAG